MRALLDAVGVEYEIDPTLVRGLDYYTRTIFSFVCERLGAQSEIGGGGRYDGLIEQLGGPADPGVGWAAGIERILLALEGEHEGEAAESDVFVVAESEDDRRTAATLVAELRRRRHLGPGRPRPAAVLKGQLKHADRVGAQQRPAPEADGSAVAARHAQRRARRVRTADRDHRAAHGEGWSGPR